MGCCGEASGWAKVGLLCIICALGLQAAGYVTNNWMVYNTVKDQVDVRVGLWWFTNCSADITCYTETTPFSYKSLMFNLTIGLEGGMAGLLLIITVIYSFYVMADRSRTRCMAITIIIFLVIAVGCSIAGLVLWIIQIDYPYFLAWSAGLSVVATGFSLISLLCLIPDLNQYPYERLQIEPEERYYKIPWQFKTNGKSQKVPERDISVKNSKEFDKNKDYMDPDIERFSLNVVTPSQPPRGDFFTNKLPNGKRF